MFAHVSLGITNIEKSLGFYDTVMEALGYSRLFGDVKEKFMAYGPEDSFFIICEPLNETKKVVACNGTHICLKAPSKEAVDQFHKLSIKNGGQDDGPPGIREEYATDYYAAFVLDPDGHKIEVLARVTT